MLAPELASDRRYGLQHVTSPDHERFFLSATHVRIAGRGRGPVNIVGVGCAHLSVSNACQSCAYAVVSPGHAPFKGQ